MHKVECWCTYYVYCISIGEGKQTVTYCKQTYICRYQVCSRYVNWHKQTAEKSKCTCHMWTNYWIYLNQFNNLNFPAKWKGPTKSFHFWQKNITWYPYYMNLPSNQFGLLICISTCSGMMCRNNCDDFTAFFMKITSWKSNR